METEIIRLFDNEDYEYPLIEIKKGHYADFCDTLKEYQKQEDYNLDEFISLLSKKKWFIQEIYYDRRIFF